MSRGTVRFPSSESGVHEAANYMVAIKKATVAIVNTTMATRNSRTLMASMADTPSGRPSVAATLAIGAEGGEGRYASS